MGKGGEVVCWKNFEPLSQLIPSLNFLIQKQLFSLRVTTRNTACWLALETLGIFGWYGTDKRSDK